MRVEQDRPDVELVTAWRRGDADAGERLFDRYYEGVVRFFRNKTDDASRDDLVQKTFLACVDGLTRLDDPARFRSYLFAIAYRVLCRHYRDRRRERARIDFATASAQDLGPSPTGLLRAREEQRLLLGALRRIPVESQAVLELVYWERMTAAEVAAVFGVPVGTAKSRLRRARQQLGEAVASLARSDALLQSTLDDVERWAASVRERMRED